MSSANHRRGGPARVVLASVSGAALGLVLWLPAAPALAAGPGLDDGADPGAEIGVGTAIVLFAVLPVIILLSIAALVLLPTLISGSRYRPQRGWAAAPLWFAGPPDPVAAVQTADVSTTSRGGASGSW